MNQWTNDVFSFHISSCVIMSRSVDFRHGRMQGLQRTIFIIELSLQCRAHFADLIGHFAILKCKSSSRYSPVRFLSTTFTDQAPKSRKQRPSFGDHRSHFTRKNIGLRAENAFTREFTRFRTVTLPNYLMMGGWHDDVADTVMEMRPWQSSVTRKFSN